ncbi:MAG: hypothetical protein IPJ34_32390 [Myxococcales bacterium]|nr:hypothetical protein [Myxococcales bacterium]
MAWFSCTACTSGKNASAPNTAATSSRTRGLRRTTSNATSRPTTTTNSARLTRERDARASDGCRPASRS